MKFFSTFLILFVGKGGADVTAFETALLLFFLHVTILLDRINDFVVFNEVLFVLIDAARGRGGSRGRLAAGVPVVDVLAVRA
jgi:hypothetical protein